MARWFSIKPGLTLKGRKFKGIRGWAGKPFHPPLTDIPIAAYILGAAFDVLSILKRPPEVIALVDGNQGVPLTYLSLGHDLWRAATFLFVAGLIVSIPTAITGFWDWLKSTPKHSQAWRTANWHMAVMLTMSIVVAFNILARLASWDGGYADTLVTVLSLVVALAVIYGAAYGGSMVYDYAFNVESDIDHAYTKSERDRLPGQKGDPDEVEGETG